MDGSKNCDSSTSKDVVEQAAGEGYAAGTGKEPVIPDD